jgi:starch synthase
MKILMAGSEMAPFVKTGGLGDVLGALPDEIGKLGHEVLIVIPFYRNEIRHTKSTVIGDISGKFDMGGRSCDYCVYELNNANGASKILLVECDEFFGRAGLYVDPKTRKDFEDNYLRFAFFPKAVLHLTAKLNWSPDIINVHDWQTALIPIYVKRTSGDDNFFAKSRTVLTIHNLAYQGVFKMDGFSALGLPDNLVRPMGEMEYYGKMNYLKGGILFSDKITTVSHTYAREIQSELGCGLEGVLVSRTQDISGILNGVDYEIWSPATDKLIKFAYRESNLSGKRKNKTELLKAVGFSLSEGVPLIGMVSRLVEQKGMKLIVEAAEELFSLNMQMVILGTGEKELERALVKLAQEYPKKLKVILKFDERLAHMIEAGSDIYLMPSMFEPCGLNQMYSLKYGTPPIVHNVGGLADTIVDYNEMTAEGTGFIFNEFTVASMMGAVTRALDLFNKKKKWSQLIKNGMKQDYSWKSSAKQYVQLFESLKG